MKIRCEGVPTGPLYINYHDNEWGVPEHEDWKLFKFLILEGVQAGLNWLTILRKRDSYRKTFDDFDTKKIAKYDERKLEELLSNSEIVRNKLKIVATIQNAKAFLAIEQEFGSFDTYI
jgi:DNA-3-methyladenine glycosylase I